MGTTWCPACAASVQAIPVGELAGIPLIAGGRLEGPLQRAIHTYKYGGRRGLAAPLARPVLKAVSGRGALLSGLTFVPLHPSRQRERGFNQAERLARELAVTLGLPLVGGLARQRATPAQVGLGQAARRENMLGVFAWTSPRPAPAGLGLVDDVCTTGATLEAAAAAVGAGGGGVAAFLVVAAAQTLAPPVVRTPGTVCLS
jgi:predicted amidophosphoribosyltransferase